MGILSIDLTNINVDDANFYVDDPKTLIHVRLLVWHKLKKCARYLKK